MKICLLKKVLLLLVLKSAFAISAPAQVTASIASPVTSLDSQETLKDFLSTLERKFNVYFTFESILVRDKEVPPNATISANLDETLRRVLPQLDLDYKKVSDKYYVIFREHDSVPADDQSPEKGNDDGVNPPVETTQASVLSSAVQVSGRITDETGQGMPAVNVVEKGTTNGVVADVEGRFAIQVRGPESILVISFVGYKTVEETVGSRTEINVQLQPDVSTLSEIVVVGYSTQDKKALTAAVSTIKPEEITNRPVANMYQAMQGLAPNLTIQQNNAEPGSVPVLNIRGVGSFTDNSPLIIVDGIVVGPLGLNYLNPNDVESISVLKDAASAAIYGSQAANGVIYVTTKRGKKDQKPSVQYSGLFGLQSPTTSPKPVQAWEFMTLKNEALDNSGGVPQFTPEQIEQQRAQGSYPWAYEKMVNNTVPMLNQNISITGGGANTSYLLSAGYLNQQSMFNGDYIPDDQRFYYKRYNFRTNVSTAINKYIEAGVNLSYTNGTNRMHAFSTGLLIRDAMRTPRIYPIRDENNNWVVPELTSNSVFAQLVEGGWKLTQSNNLLGGLNVTIRPLEHLKINVNTSANYSFYNEELQRREFDYAPEYSAGAAPPQFNEQNKASWNDLNTTFFATAEYDKTIGKHYAKILAGYRSDFVRMYSHVSAYRADGIIIDEDHMIGGDFVRNNDGEIEGDIGRYNGITNPELKTVNSVFGRVNYAYNDRYLAEFTWRYDGATVLAPKNRWFFFPAFSLGWRVTDEPFMESVQGFADIKLRYSWGQVGNSNIGGFNYLARVNPVLGQYSFNNTGVQGVNFTPVNPELEWERSTMNDVGIDITLFQGKLSGSFDYFDKMTDGIYFTRVVPGTFGQSSSIENFAKVRNVGWEVSVNYHATSGPVNHTVGFNVADNTNKILKMGEEQIHGADFSYIMREGYPISAYYLYKSDGLYQNLDDIENAPQVPFAPGQAVHPGDIRYVDKDGDGTIDGNDRFILGTPFPRYTFGITYSATYKNFDFQMFWQGVGKRSQYLRGDIVEAFHNNEEHLFVQHKDRWTPTNPDATYPRLTANSSANTNNTAYSDYWLFDTKYIRLKNVQLGYTLPQSLTSKAGIQAFRIYFSAQNLLTFAPKRFARLGMDPEFTQFDNKLNFANYDPIAGRNYPNAKVLAIGADIKF